MNKKFKITEKLIVEAIESVEHLLLFSTKMVAVGYDITEETIRWHKTEKLDELHENIHWVVGKTNTLGGIQDATLWTLRGVLRLGFFIKSTNGKFFRDWAEDILYKYAIERLKKKKELRAKIKEKKVELFDLEEDLKQIEKYLIAQKTKLELESFKKQLKEIENGEVQSKFEII